MAQPWDRQTNEKGKKEPIRSYEYFTEYLLMDKPRSLARLNKKLGKKPSYVRQLESYSSTWKWVSRAEAHDEYLFEKRRARKEQLYENLVESELPEIIQQLGYVNENIKDLSMDKSSRPASVSKGFEQGSRAKKNLMEIFLTLAGKPKEYTAGDLRVDADLTAEAVVGLEMEAKTVDEIIGIVDDELEDIYESGRETDLDGEG